MSMHTALENMKALRDQMDIYRSQTDAAEEREKYAKEQIKAAEAKIDLAKATMASFQVRIDELNQSLRKVNIQNDIQGKNLANTQKKTEDEYETARKKEQMEEETDYAIADLEDKIRRADQFLVEKEKTTEDLLTRYDIKKEIYDELQRKLESLDMKANEKTAEISSGKQRVANGQEQEKAQEERLKNMEDTITELEGGIMTKTTKFDEADRRMNQLKEEVFTQNESINEYEMRNRRCREELGNISDTAGQIAQIMKQMWAWSFYSKLDLLIVSES